MTKTMIGLGWRLHSWEAVVVAVSGPAASPVIVHREQVTLLQDASIREPYHAAAVLVSGSVGPNAERALREAQALIASVERAAAAAAVATIRAYVSLLGPIAAVGVVGGNRPLPTKLSQRLASHARWHASERELYEQAIIRGATTAGLPVATIPATGQLFSHASQVLGVALESSLAAVGRSIGPPWKKTHKEATAAALVALKAVA
jgi:hypothetical protein